MIAVDTNLLVYAHRVDSQWHDAAAERLRSLADSGQRWAIPWPCLHEFFAKVTHPKIFNEPTPRDVALSFLGALQATPTVSLLAEDDGYFPILERLVRGGRVAGPMVHDARIAALCLFHGVRELWSSDRDFGRFPELKTRNPLVEPSPG